MKLYRRENYLKKMRGFFHDTGIIKVITGVRRCGKSCLMLTIAEELRLSGVPEENIIFLNLDKRGYRSIKTPEALDSLIAAKSSGSGVKYLFIDEVQNVAGFEEVINGFREEEEYSIFITGSYSIPVERRTGHQTDRTVSGIRNVYAHIRRIRADKTVLWKNN